MSMTQMLSALLGSTNGTTTKGAPKADVKQVVYGVAICRDGYAPLRWLDKTAGEYFVQHYADGSIQLRPLGKWSYIVKATDDDLLELKTTGGAGEDYIEVRHLADGTIWLRTKEAAKRHGEANDKSVVWQSNPLGVADDYVKVYQYAERRRDEVLIEREVERAQFSGYSVTTKKMRYIHDNWDRSFSGPEGLNNRPRELLRLEERERFSSERWAEIEADEARRRDYQRAYREKRKAIEAGLLPPTPRLLKERQKRVALSASTSLEVTIDACVSDAASSGHMTGYA